MRVAAISVGHAFGGFGKGFATNADGCQRFSPSPQQTASISNGTQMGAKSGLTLFDTVHKTAQLHQNSIFTLSFSFVKVFHGSLFENTVKNS